MHSSWGSRVYLYRLPIATGFQIGISSPNLLSFRALYLKCTGWIHLDVNGHLESGTPKIKLTMFLTPQNKTCPFPVFLISVKITNKHLVAQVKNPEGFLDAFQSILHIACRVIVLRHQFDHGTPLRWQGSRSSSDSTDFRIKFKLLNMQGPSGPACFSGFLNATLLLPNLCSRHNELLPHLPAVFKLLRLLQCFSLCLEHFSSPLPEEQYSSYLSFRSWLRFYFLQEAFLTTSSWLRNPSSTVLLHVH